MATVRPGWLRSEERHNRSQMLKLSWRQAAAWRVHRQHLDRRAPAGGMLAIASRLCGLHAQVMSSAELTIWARVEGVKRGEVHRALWDQRTLLKTWAMRGTLHLLPSSEMPFWHAALRDSRRYVSPALWRRFGMSLREAELLTESIGRALSGRMMTRQELGREVARIAKSPKLGKTLIASSWGTILKPAAYRGGLCFGPSAGQLVRFTHPETWLDGVLSAAPRVDLQAVPATITRRFLDVYGPATHHDFGRWWGNNGIATARKWLVAMGDEVTEVDVEGSPMWMVAPDARQARELPPLKSARLIPAFDQYVIAASRHAAHLLPGDLRRRVYRPQGWISAVLLINGRMDGVWRHEIKGSRVDVTIEPFVPVPAWARRAANEEAERLAGFFKAKLNLVWNGNRR